MPLRRITLSVPDGLPKEFRLFKAGENETTKGVFVFDEEAARAVVAAAKDRGGIDYPIDLEHLSIDDERRNYDPDARGWFELEVRNGELWAVNVRWTPDGQRRLEERTQRYVSPAFMTDEDGRVTEIVNVALVAMPATQGTPALVAANRRSPRMTLKDRKSRLAARLSIARGKLQKLADAEDGGGETASGKFAAIKAAADKAQEALAEIDKASGDVDSAMSAVEAAMAAVEEFEKAVSAMGGGSADEPEAAPAPAAAAADKGQDDAQKMARKEAEVISLRKELARRDEQAKVEKLAREMDERRGLVGELVKLGRETPATAWTDETATTPRGSLSTMPLAELRTRIEAFRKVGSILLGGPQAPREGCGVTGGGGEPVLGELEVQYVRARHAALVGLGLKLRSLDDSIARYTRHKVQQLRGAEQKGDRDVLQKLSAPIEKRTVQLGVRAGLVTLASTPVQPFDEFGASSQIAMQSFRLEYNLALASLTGGWSESVGRLLPDGSLKTTFPLNFRALKYQEKTAQNAATGQPQNADIPVTQREFFEGQMVELRRLVKGDFAYVQSWAQLAADLARARVFLRDELVQGLLESSSAGGGLALWGVTPTLSGGIDGANFFSASHAVNPFDATMKLRGSATFSNYQGSATPVTATNLISEKNQALQVAAPDGRELGIVYDGILYPSALEQTVYNLLKVQDLILDAKATLNSVNNVFAGVRNPNFNSGLEMTRAQQLAGTDTTANWYLYSREAIARGLIPWVIAEDPTEEVRLFDESSDFYKTTGFIKWESHVFLNAVLLYPHAIRLVKGS